MQGELFHHYSLFLEASLEKKYLFSTLLANHALQTFNFCTTVEVLNYFWVTLFQLKNKIILKCVQSNFSLDAHDHWNCRSLQVLVSSCNIQMGMYMLLVFIASGQDMRTTTAMPTVPPTTRPQPPDIFGKLVQCAETFFCPVLIWDDRICNSTTFAHNPSANTELSFCNHDFVRSQSSAPPNKYQHPLPVIVSSFRVSKTNPNILSY